MPDRKQAEVVDIQDLKVKRSGSISLCMIARDEEECIAAALESVKDLADEMIVVDTGSADRTAEVARRCGARVLPFAWGNDFAAARNAALEAARCRWILVLDADERMEAADRETIRVLARGGRREAYLFEQRTYTRESDGFACGKVPDAIAAATGAAAVFSDRQVRLFPNEPDLRYACEMHEHLDESLLLADVPVRDGGVVVHHDGRLRDDGRVHRKALVWRALGREELDAFPAHPRYLYELAAQFLALGLCGAAARHAEAALSAAPRAWQPWNVAGLAHLRAGERENALSCFRVALRGAGENAEVRNNLGAALMEGGESAEALLWFERALEAEGDNPDILRNAAAASLFAGEPERASSHIDRSLAIDPFVAHSHAIKAEICERLGDRDGAVRVLEHMRFLADIPFKVHLKIVQLYTRMHLVAEADAAAGRAVASFPDREDVAYLAGKIAELRGDDERAAGYYRRVLAARPDHADALESIGCIYDRQERFDEALAAFREALRRRPARAQLEVNLGIVLDKLGMGDEAERCFARAMERGEQSGFAYNALGCHHARSNRFDEAFACFAKAVELEAGNASYHRNLGLACEKMRLYEKAAEAYERLAAIDPGTAPSMRERIAYLRSVAAGAAL